MPSSSPSARDGAAASRAAAPESAHSRTRAATEPNGIQSVNLDFRHRKNHDSAAPSGLHPSGRLLPGSAVAPARIAASPKTLMDGSRQDLHERRNQDASALADKARRGLSITEIVCRERPVAGSPGPLRSALKMP